jgi:hypothetical protein
MSWADTTAGVMKMRNGANSAWISLYELDGTFLASDISLAAGSAAAPSLFFTGDTNTGLFSPGADTVALATAGSNRLHITSGGLVGIGTTGPLELLHVNNASAANTRIRLTNATTGTGSFDGLDLSCGSTGLASLIQWEQQPFQIFTNNGTAVDPRLTITAAGNVGIGTTTPGANHALEIGGSQKYLSVTPNTGASGGVNPSSSSGLHFGWNRSNGDGEGNLIYGVGVGGAPRLSIASWDGTTLTERMKIDNIGRTEIGHGSAADVLILRNSNNSLTSALLSMSTVRAAGTSCVFFYATANNVNTFNVFNNGNVTNTNNSYGAISDIKLKENIVDATSQWSDIKALQVRKYNFKEGQTHTQIGLVAQEVELISPGLVTESPDRDEEGNDLGTVTKSVNYSVLYMKAVKALQEAMERIETLEASNADMLARVTALEGN